MSREVCLVGENEDFSYFSLYYLKKKLPNNLDIKVVINQESNRVHHSDLYYGRNEYFEYFYDNAFKDLDFYSLEEILCFYRNKKFENIESIKENKLHLLPEENLFRNKRTVLDISSYKSEVSDFVEKKENFLKTKLISIKRESERWHLLKGDNTTISCDELYFGLNFESFLELYEGGGELEEELLKYNLGLKKIKKLVVNFDVEGQVLENLNTVFIPQNLSQHEGHFIGEFFPYDTKLNCQRFNFICFLNEEDDFEKVVSSKLKKIRRTIFKLFPELKKFKMEQIIDIEEDWVPKKDFAEKKENILSKYHLHFFGEGAPLMASYWKKRKFEGKRVQMTGLLRKMLAIDQCAFRES